MEETINEIIDGKKYKANIYNTEKEWIQALDNSLHLYSTDFYYNITRDFVKIFLPFDDIEFNVAEKIEKIDEFIKELNTHKKILYQYQLIEDMKNKEPFLYTAIKDNNGNKINPFSNEYKNYDFSGAILDLIENKLEKLDEDINFDEIKKKIH